MSNYNRYPSKRGPDPVVTALMVFSVTTCLFGIARCQANDERDNQYDTELQNQLSHNYSDVTELSLDYDKQTFSFETRTKSQNEQCHGNYIIANSAASIAGAISCKQIVVPVAPSTN